MRKELFLTCSCHWIEHQLVLGFETDDGWNDECFIQYHLRPFESFWRRLFRAVKYAFNPKCPYGSWDEFILKKEDTKRLIDYLTEVHAIQSKNAQSKNDKQGIAYVK